MLYTAFYMPIFPPGILISFIGLFLIYCWDKWVLLYKYQKSDNLNGSIAKNTISFIGIMWMIWFASSSIFFGIYFSTN